MERLRKLYEAAIEFKKVKCWEWMLEHHIFGVMNPETEEIGYCSIMGYLGEYYAFSVYPGAKAIGDFLKVEEGLIPAEDFYFLQDCIRISYEDRKYLSKDDLKTIKQLGFKFRGRNAWPLFRRYEPGLVPRPLNEGEISFLTVALWQGIDVALRFKSDPSLLMPPEEGHFLVRVPVKKGREIKWEDRWMPLERTNKRETKVIDMGIVKEIRKLQNLLKLSDISWEIDFVVSHIPVKEKGKRGFYPLILFIVDKSSGLVLNSRVIKLEDLYKQFPLEIVNTIKKVEIIPGEILFRREEFKHLLEPLRRKLNIKLTYTIELPMADAIRKSFLGFLMPS